MDNDQPTEDGATSEPTPPPSPMPQTPIKSAEERKAALEVVLASELSTGKSRIESKSDFTAVLVSGKKVNHVLHLILTLLTAGLWLFVWLVIVITNSGGRKVISVDAYGNVTTK
jgi:hypothetical protein